MLDQFPRQDDFSCCKSTLLWFKDMEPYPVRCADSIDAMDPDTRSLAGTTEEFHCKMFTLTNPEDLSCYQTVKQRIVFGWYTQVKELTKWEDEPKVWLEWIQTYKDLK